METQDNKSITSDKNSPEQKTRSGRAMGGLIIVTVGAVWLASRLGLDIPYWVFTWPMFLITLGFYIGARHSFKNPGWLIPVAIGTFFLLNDFVMDIPIKQYIWPLAIIVIGLVMIFKPKRRNRDQYWKNWEKNSETSSEDIMDSVAVFGSLKKNVISKDFKGGEAVMVFSGAEINLSQADINGKAVVELTQVFAGTKLIVPPHWTIQTDDVVCIFGGIEDKRHFRQEALTDTNKILVLKGTCIFGGIDIKSF